MASSVDVFVFRKSDSQDVFFEDTVEQVFLCPLINTTDTPLCEFGNLKLHVCVHPRNIQKNIWAVWLDEMEVLPATWRER